MLNLIPTVFESHARSLNSKALYVYEYGWYNFLAVCLI